MPAPVRPGFGRLIAPDQRDDGANPRPVTCWLGLMRSCGAKSGPARPVKTGECAPKSSIEAKRGRRRV